MKLPDFLRSYVPLSPEQEKEFFTCFKMKRYEKGSFLFKQGQICKEIFFIEKGFARNFYYNSSGKEITAWFFAEESVVTAIDSFYYKKETPENCELLEDSVVYVISLNELETLVNQNHDFARIAFYFLLSIVSQANEYIVNLKLQTAKDKYKSLLSSNPDIFQRASLTHIASFLGITRETLSRLRSEK